MSLNFKTELDEMRKNNPASEDASQTDYKASQNYDTPGHVRNLCFVWPDGRMKFMNYAYLVSAEYLPNEGFISLIFTTDTVVIKGIGLELLFMELLMHLPKTLACANSRYTNINTKNKMIVTDITN